MNSNFEAHRRILLVAYARYLVADRALEQARMDARSWFPEMPTRSTRPIGDPNSPIRRLYEQRERAIERVALARRALQDTQARLRKRLEPTIYLIDVH